MASTEPLVFRWGIISTGFISTKVTEDLLVDPKTRDVQDVVHKIAAVGSRTVDKAQEFIDKVCGGDKSVKAYGSYDGVYADNDVDAVYIGTPHTHHYQNAKDAILAKKHVLCEKPVTSNAAELRSLLALAKEHGVFFMEALWTRFQPLSLAIKKLIDEGSLGPIIVLHADLSHDFDVENMALTHRILDPKLGGGALLDLGPYPMFWAMLAQYENPANKRDQKPLIAGSMVKTPLTGVDANTAFTLVWPALPSQSILSCGITTPSPTPGVTMRFRNGNIIVQGPLYCPKTFSVQYFDKPGSGNVVREETRTFAYTGSGWHFQADEVARCVRAGKMESELWGHDRSVMEMEIFDEVRRQGKYEFPAGVEQVV